MDIILKEYNSDDRSVIEKITEPLYLDKFKEFDAETLKVVCLDGKAVGWVHTYIPDSSLYSGFVFIYVSPGYRRSGIGTKVYRMAEEKLISAGCNWWTEYPASEASDRFCLFVGFDYTNTNLCMIHDGTLCALPTDGIRPCRADDFPSAPDIWSREYAEMHRRIGLPYERREKTEEERRQQYEEFIANLNNRFVIESDGRVVGYGVLFADNSGVGSVAVDRAYAGRGYGTRLTAYLTDECIRRGNAAPCLYCEIGNDDALHIYRKLGYTEKSRETVAVKN